MVYDEHFSDLEAAMESVHACFQESEEDEEAEALCCLRLAVHEWMANLIRHARFGERCPEVHVRIWREEARLCCVIEDNSKGFDLDTHLDEQPDLIAQAGTFPDGGLGLLMLDASTEALAYERLGAHRNRLSMAVRSTPHDSEGDPLQPCTDT